MSGKQRRPQIAAAPLCSADAQSVDTNQVSELAPYGNASLSEQIAMQSSTTNADVNPDVSTITGKGAAGLSVLGTVSRMAAEKMGDVSGGATVYNALAGAAAPLRAAHHFTGEHNPAQSGGGRAAWAGALAAGETATAVGLNGARMAAKAAPDLVAKTSTFASTPAAVAGGMLAAHEMNGGLRGGLDVAHTVAQGVSGDTAGMYRGAERIEHNATNGEYGFIAQAGTLAASQKARERSIDRAAERGDRGKTIAYGNAVGDLWADAMGHSSQDGGAYVDADAHQAELDAMRWYKPWTW